MDSVNPRNHANDVARPAGPAETFVGTIRWIALAIGVACLALLTLVGSVAHAACMPCAGACSPGHERMRARAGALADRHPVQPADTAERRAASRQR
jgi:hypothetical protein